MMDGLIHSFGKARAGTLFLVAVLAVPSAWSARWIVAANPAPKAPMGRVAAASVNRPVLAPLGTPGAGAAAPVVPVEEKTDILSFQQWKQEKIREASLKLDEVRKEQGPAKKAADGEEGQAFQAEWNLETAQELEITDYIVIYLSQFAGSKKFEEAAARLTKAEIAMVMERYISMIQRGNKLRNTDAKAANGPRPTQNRPVQALSTTH